MKRSPVFYEKFTYRVHRRGILKVMIYCVEDDASIRELIIYTLKLSGFEALGFEEGDAMFEELDRQIPDLILLDIMLPGRDGLQILSELKQDPRFADIPVIMATARTSEYDRVIGLDSGADDYLSKPFGMMEMISRVKAVLRRGRKANTIEQITFSDVVIDKQRRTVEVAGEPVELTLKEFELLLTLAENKGIVFSRQQLLEKVWGSDYLGESRTIDVHVGTLRSKLGAYGSDISTIRGVGYCLKEEEDGE